MPDQDDRPAPAPFSLWRSLVRMVAALALGTVALAALLFSSCGIMIGASGWFGGQGYLLVLASVAVFGLVVLVLRRLFR